MNKGEKIMKRGGIRVFHASSEVKILRVASSRVKVGKGSTYSYKVDSTARDSDSSL